MRHIAAIAIVLLAGAAAAQDWQRLDSDDALHDLLVAHPLEYDTGATQSFNASGRTLYRHAETSWGHWRVEAGRYCSKWPPGDAWDCYDIETDGAGAVRFIDDWGNASVGMFAE